jgi:predicted O-methyltransferase YrrM
MFHEIPDSVVERMQALETEDALDRTDGTPRMERLRQIPPETGRFIAMLAASAPPGALIEVGTSAGYSTLWLALAARELGRTVTTFEILPEKAARARETFEIAKVGDTVTLVEGDALSFLSQTTDIAFCFLDAEKEVYGLCYEAVVPNLVAGGLLVADNAINHQETLQPMIDRALSDVRVDSVVVPIGKGELIVRRL